jgi:hypothetical protein
MDRCTTRPRGSRSRSRPCRWPRPAACSGAPCCAGPWGLDLRAHLAGVDVDGLGGDDLLAELQAQGQRSGLGDVDLDLGGVVGRLDGDQVDGRGGGVALLEDRRRGGGGVRQCRREGRIVRVLPVGIGPRGARVDRRSRVGRPRDHLPVHAAGSQAAVDRAIELVRARLADHGGRLGADVGRPELLWLPTGRDEPEVVRGVLAVRVARLREPPLDRVADLGGNVAGRPDRLQRRRVERLDGARDRGGSARGRDQQSGGQQPAEERPTDHATTSI